MTTPVAVRPVQNFDPQGHQMGPLGTIAAQASLILGLIWVMGVLGGLLLPPTVGILTLAPVLGAALLAPRSIVMQFPVSFSILGIYTITIASVAWTIDGLATSATIKGLIPGMLAIMLAGGLLGLRDVADALIWATYLAIFITIVALVVFPETRLHLGDEFEGGSYPGWHGFFNHKNNMTSFLVMMIPVILTFSRSVVAKWATLGVIGILLVGSASATGASAAFFAGVTWVWLRIYQSQEDTRNSTLFAFVTLLGSIGVVAAALSSIATITSAYGKDTTFSGRTEIWEASIDAFLRRPWLGHGYGALFWREDLSPETAQIWRQVGFEASHAHNGALDMALQIGLVGLGIFAVLFITTARMGWSVLKTQPDLGIWVVTAMASNLLMSLSEDVFFGGWLAMFALMKMLLMRRRESINRPSYRDGMISKWS
jgi:O-antigen ligase